MLHSFTQKEYLMKKSIIFSLILLSSFAGASADHSCKEFAEGKSSYSSRILTDVGMALAGTAANTLEEKLLFAFWPLWHSIFHEETENLTDLSKWLASNWTAVGLSGLVYAIGQKRGWNEQTTLRSILGVLYGQSAVAIATAKAQEMELI